MKFLFFCLFPMLSFAQWTKIEPKSLPITLYCDGIEEFTFRKDNEDEDFELWYNRMSDSLRRYADLNHIESCGFELIDIEVLKRSYNSATFGGLLKLPKTSSAAIELVSHNFMYRNCDNLINANVLWPSEATRYRIEATDATVNEVISDNEILHSINPKGSNTEITIIADIGNGEEQQFGPWYYNVIPIPEPQIVNTEISKSGGIIHVRASSFIIRTYEVKSILLNGEIEIPGNIIPSSAISKVKLDKIIPITVSVSDSKSGQIYSIKGALKVVK